MTGGVVGQARATARLAAFLVLTVVFASTYALSLLGSRALQRRVQRGWCAATCRAAGLTVVVDGDPVTGPEPVLLLANHVSYFDVPVIGSTVEATFVAKSEVAAWPLFGWLSRLTNTVFVPRDGREARRQLVMLGDRLRAGDSLILFPEGTNSDGSDVLPFKSSLLAVASPETIGRAVLVQPVSLAFLRLRTGEPLTGPRRDLYAWVGIDGMFPHLWRALSAPGAEARVVFHPPLSGSDAAGRKVLARRAEQTVREGVARMWMQQGERSDAAAG
ncbi:MAG: lysophospholipid acyltransferase family protein [Pseudomonadota bacterium]